MFRSFLAGQLATMRELALCYAPNINSYKRFAAGSFAPDRRCGYRQSHLRPARGRPRAFDAVENRAPGGDVNQYLAVAALIAGGLYGIDRGLEPPSPSGQRHATDARRLPTTLAEAAELFGNSEVARSAFGDDGWSTTSTTPAETAAFNAAVTDWERVRVLSGSEVRPGSARTGSRRSSA